MEIRSRDILGSPVFAVDKGENLGQVKDYVFDPETRTIVALVIAGTKRLKDEKILPRENIRSLGQVAITIDDAAALTPKGSDGKIAALLKKRGEIVGINVITTNCGALGRVTDFYINSTTGAVTCLVLGGKPLDRFIKGNNFLDASMIQVFGSDVILAKEEAIASTVKPREQQSEEIQEPSKEARSNSVWNRNKEKIAAKTKEYGKKLPVKAVFTDLTKNRENPLPDTEGKTQSKGRISYKSDKETES
ncbi:MAG: PRC-barrel domain-containing protein [Bacillota bacterium]|nr:PRC-barrel domain-containing protein [Bacillota bacterium]